MFNQRHSRPPNKRRSSTAVGINIFRRLQQLNTQQIVGFWICSVIAAFCFPFLLFSFINAQEKATLVNCKYLDLMNVRLKSEVQNLSSALVTRAKEGESQSGSEKHRFDFIQSEFQNFDSEYKKFEIRRNDPNGDYLKQTGKVVILTITKDRIAFGCAGTRGIEEYLQTISAINYPASKISLALMTNSLDEYESFKAVLNAMRFDSLGYHSVRLFHRESTWQFRGAHRRLPKVQRERRREIARQRNFLVSVGIENEDFALWVDADVITIQPRTLSKFVASGKDIIATNTVNGANNEPFDGNTWVGPRKKPTQRDRERISRGELFIPGDEKGLKHMWDLMDTNEEFVEIDSVGGTVLFVRANVFREGAIFPTQYIIGAEWEHEGYDGIETEGLCYLAGRLGYKCWGMPHELAWHHIGCDVWF